MQWAGIARTPASSRLARERVDRAGVERGRLLDEDMLARPDRRAHEVDVRVGRRADRDEPDVAPREQRLDRALARDAVDQLVRAARGDKIPCAGGRLTRVERRAHRAASPRRLGRRVRGKMGPAHEAEPDDADAHDAILHDVILHDADIRAGARAHCFGAKLTPLSM